MKRKISANQLFCAIILVPYGSAVLFFLAPNSKQDSWITLLIYILPTVLLQIVYTSLWKKYPSDTIVTYMPKIFGKVIGYTISILYIIYFAYIASRVLRDITELITIAVMPVMSPIIITLMLISVIGYITYLDIENPSRLTHVIFYLFVFFFILEWIFLFTTPNALKFYNLKPILENGIMPVIKEGWKLITFPFGESILLTMLYPLVVEVSKVRKATVLAIIFLGILLSLNTIMFISVLGVDFASNSTSPLLQTMRIMQIGESFDRVDIFIILIMLLGGFIKASFFMYGAMLGTTQLLKIKATKYLALPFSILVFIISLLIAKNYFQHIYIGLVWTVLYIHLPLIIIIPIVAWLVYYIRHGFKKADTK